MEVLLERIQGLQSSINALPPFSLERVAKEVRNFVRDYDVCQRYKYENVASPGLIQPLPIPDGIFTDVCMDCISVLPVSKGKHIIVVGVD